MKDLIAVAQQKVLQSADLRIELRMYPAVGIRAKDLAFPHPYVSKPYTLFPSLFYKIPHMAAFYPDQAEKSCRLLATWGSPFARQNTC
jgi:hypothetical protein